MRIPYGFNLSALGTLEIKETEAETVCMIFDYCELKKPCVDLLRSISGPSGNQL